MPAGRIGITRCARVQIVGVVLAITTGLGGFW